MRKIPTLLVAAALLLLGNPHMARAASPPQLLNYQGVLRDANGLPLSGDYSMVFRLVQAGTGDEILIDEHLGGAAGTGVTVTNGLFNVQIGSGNILDGGGPGAYTSLAEVFRDFNDIVLTIEVEGEVLSPSIPIASAPFAMNATHLDGLDQGKFLRTDVPGSASGNIWFSASPTGGTINDASVLIKPISASANETIFGVGVSLSEKFRVDAEGDTFIGGLLNMPNGAQFWDNGFGLQIYGGDADTDDVFIRAGNSSDDGSIIIVGDGLMEFRSGNGVFSLLDGAGNGGAITADSLSLTVSAGATDDNDGVWMKAGNNGADGLIAVNGNAPIVIRSATDIVVLQDSMATNMTVFESGDLQMGKELTLSAFGGFGPARITAQDELRQSAAGFYSVVIDRNSTISNAKVEWYHHVGLTNSDRLAELQEDGDLLIRGMYSNSVSFDIAESFLAAESLEAGDVVIADDSRHDTVRLASRAGDGAVIGVVSTQPGMLLGGAPLDPEVLERAWGSDVYEEFLLGREDLRLRVLSAHEDLRWRLEAAEVPGAIGQARSNSSQYAERAQKRAIEQLVRLHNEVESLALELFCRERFAPIALAGRVPVKVDAGYGSIRVGDLLTTSPTPGHAMRADDPKPGTVIGKALEGLETGTGLIKVLVMLR